MIRFSSYLCAAVLFAAPARAASQEIEGNWIVTFVVGGSVEQASAIVKIEVRDGQAKGELVALGPRLPGVVWKSVALEGKLLRVAFGSATSDMVFEATLPKGEAKRILGTLAINANLYPAWLAKTEQTELDAKSSTRLLDCPPMQQAKGLSQKALVLRVRAQQTKDPEQKQALLKQAAEANEAARAEAPKLYREVLAKHADSPAVFEAALELIRSAQAADAKPAEVKAWATTAANAAKAYGSRWQGEVNAQLATALVTQEGLAGLAVEFARQAETSLAATAPAAEQVRILGLVMRALRKDGKADEAKTYEVRLGKVEEILDREYLAKMPPFKGTPFVGRKGNSERAVFLELFTGATCPPCVAADLAFDVLTKTYKPAELVLIQYHMHIPGPDPMTNPDTEARWSYYTKAFPMQVRGVPSSIINGKPTAGGGGPVGFAEKKYDAYREVIDSQLEERAFAKLSAQAQRKGDRIDIQVQVNDLVGPGSEKKLRILLAEETIRYAGSNKIRFHHNVVRAFPGGVAGKSLMAAASKHQASLDLTELRSTLTKYLDNYQANIRPFANPARPLDFANLRVIAFVQDDSTQDILQAIQVEVEGDKGAK